MVDPPDSGLGGPRGGSNVTSALGDSPLVSLSRVDSTPVPPVRGCVGSCVAGFLSALPSPTPASSQAT
jgi:hypothetical protein